jgi:2-oxoglutarate dehydrogenase E2 component (dihydrolipoamide succinyltransferase)
MAERVVMPQLGESIVEATLVRWRVRAGDTVERGQIVAEVETDKASNEIPAPRAGRVSELLVAEGATVKIGTELLRYDEAPSVGTGTRTGTGTGSSPSTIPIPIPIPTAERLPSAHLAARPENGLPASPAVRRIAREHGVNLDGLTGTGKRGRLTRDDLLRHVAEPKREAREPSPRPGTYRAPTVTPGPGDRVIPFSRRRSQIAEHMVHSLHTAAHVAAVVEIDMSRVLAAREVDKPIAAQSEIRLTVTAYAVSAVARALGEHPELNAAVMGESLVLRSAKNIGVAVDTADGLVVPVVKRADELGLLGIARAVEELSERARGGKLTAEDLGGGTFTISNPGKDGNLFGISVLRQPEVGILRMGEIKKRALVVELGGEDAIVVRPIMFAALSYDHRVIDGRTGNAFLHRVKELLEAAEPLGRSQLPTRSRGV